MKTTPPLMKKNDSDSKETVCSVADPDCIITHVEPGFEVAPEIAAYCDALEWAAFKQEVESDDEMPIGSAITVTAEAHSTTDDQVNPSPAKKRKLSGHLKTRMDTVHEGKKRNKKRPRIEEADDQLLIASNVFSCPFSNIRTGGEYRSKTPFSSPEVTKKGFSAHGCPGYRQIRQIDIESGQSNLLLQNLSYDNGNCRTFHRLDLRRLPGSRKQ